MVGFGSTLYALSWKDLAMPSGAPICALRASARPTSDSGSILERFGWVTPSANEDAAGNPGAKMQAMLGSQAKLAGWPTPMAGTPARNGNSEAGNTDSSRKTVALAGWPTPNAGPQNDTDTKWEARREAIKAQRKNGNGFGMTLGMASQLIGPARLTSSGEMLTGSLAGMESGGPLNPDHSRWLMGYPVAWGSCGATAMQSFHRSPRSSSKRSKKP